MSRHTRQDTSRAAYFYYYYYYYYSLSWQRPSSEGCREPRQRCRDGEETARV